MKRRLDSVLLGGALALSGVVSRKLGEVDRRVDELSDELADARATPPTAPPIPGMPLPTGYGLQVRGPQGESIVLPVCLPPGFELDSMMLCPEFLPRVEPAGPQRRATDGRPAPIAATALPAPAAPAPAPTPPRATGTRLDGVLQLVFGADQTFSSSLEHADEDAPIERAAPAPPVPYPETTAR
jgi:hypothetical protein